MFSKVRFCTGQNLDRKKWMHSVRQCDQDIPICDSDTHFRAKHYHHFQKKFHWIFFGCTGLVILKKKHTLCGV